MRTKGYSFMEKLRLYGSMFVLRQKSKWIKSTTKQLSHTVLGIKITAYSYWALKLLVKEIFINQEYYFEARNPAPRIFDCGANVGVATLFFKWLYPESEVYAFEPNPHAFKLIEKNVADNNLKGVKVFNCALSDNEDTIDFYIDEDLGSVFGSIRSDRKGENKVEVPSNRLSDFLKDGEVDFIKMDVEGAEWNVLNDLKQHNLIDKANEMRIEYHHQIAENDTPKFAAFLKEFEERGYGYNIKADHKGIRTFQDALISFYK